MEKSIAAEYFPISSGFPLVCLFSHFGVFIYIGYKIKIWISLT